MSDESLASNGLIMIEYTITLIHVLYKINFVIEIAEYIAENYSGKIVEVGIGYFFQISDRLEEMGFQVVKVDLKRTRSDVVIDNVCDPNHKIYRGAELILSVRPPIEIQKCIVEIGKRIGCDVIIIPLKNEIIEGGKLKNYRGISFFIFTRRS